MGFGRDRETRRRCRPGIEALEGRAVPATYRAATVAQLQADIAAVSNTSGPNTIILTSRTYDLTQELKVQNAGDLTIQGNPNSRTGTTIVAGFPNRVLEIDGGTVTLSAVTLSAGSSVEQGGGIYAQDAHLTVQRCTISGNQARQAGGGIFAQGGTLDVVNSSVGNNTVEGEALCSGGGIAATDATVTISGSSIDGNTTFASAAGTPAVAIASGGGIFAQGGKMTITGGTISANIANAATGGTSAASMGGGVATVGSNVSIARSKISINALSTIASRDAALQGSAFSTVGGSLTLTNCTLTGNLPGGQDVFNHSGATVVLRRTTVDGQELPGTFTLREVPSKPGR